MTGEGWATDERPRARPLFADLLRAVANGRRHPPGPLHQPPPQGPAPRDHRRHGRGARRLPPPAPPPAVRQRPDPGRNAPGVHRRAVPGQAGRGPGRHRRPGGDHRHHRRLPRRDRRRLRPATLEVAAEAAYDSAFTFIYSPRPGHRGRGAGPTSVDPADVVADRFERLRVVVERSALARHRASEGRVEEVLVEGPSKRDPARTQRPHRAGQAGPLPSAGRPGAPPRLVGRCADHPRRPPLPDGELLSVTAGPTPPDADPGDGYLTAPRSAERCRRGTAPAPAALATWPSSAPRRRARPRRPSRWRARLGDVEVVTADSMQVYRGMDIGTAKPSRRGARRVPHHLSTWSTRQRSGRSPPGWRRPGTPWPTSSGGATGRCSSVARPVRVRPDRRVHPAGALPRRAGRPGGRGRRRRRSRPRWCRRRGPAAWTAERDGPAGGVEDATHQPPPGDPCAGGDPG